MKNNFTQAFKELTGFDISTPDKTENTDFAGSDAKREPVSFDAPRVEQKVVTYKAFTEQPSANCTRVTGTMVIQGDIKSEDDIHVNGQVIGDIKTSANLTSTNLILGNVNAQSARVNGARIKGDISLKGDCHLGEGSVVVGDIACETLNTAGKVKGNCHVTEGAVFSESAYLLGDIEAKDLSTQQGAKIIGSIRIVCEEPDLDADFDFGGDF